MIGRLNPLTGLGLLALLGVGVSFLFDPVPVALLHGTLLVVLLAARVPVGALLRWHGVFVPFAVGVLMTNAVSRPGELLAVVGPLRVTDVGVGVGAALALRVFVIGVPAIVIARATDPTRLVTAAMTHLRIGHRTGYAVLTAHRMLGAMPERWSTLLAAGRVRAPLRRGRPRLGVCGYARAAFALLVDAIRQGDRIADALEVRGIRTPARTQRVQVPFTRLDGVAAAGVTVLAVAAVGAGMLATAG